MYKASKERAVGMCVALEREEAMKWLDNDRYLAVVNHLAGAGNPEACFIVGLALIFAPQDMQRSLVFLERAAVAGHKAAAYVLGLGRRDARHWKALHQAGRGRASRRQVRDGQEDQPGVQAVPEARRGHGPGGGVEEDGWAAGPGVGAVGGRPPVHEHWLRRGRVGRLRRLLQ